MISNKKDKKEMKFIRYAVEVDVDGLKAINRYRVKACYDKIITDSRGTYAEYCEKIIDEFDYTWKEIERDGGIEQVNKDLKELYGENCFR